MVETFHLSISDALSHAQMIKRAIIQIFIEELDKLKADQIISLVTLYYTIEDQEALPL